MGIMELATDCKVVRIEHGKLIGTKHGQSHSQRLRRSRA
jgi:hypothetical protein